MESVKKSVSLPIFWTSNSAAFMDLFFYASAGDLCNLPEEIPQGHHIILVDPQTPEVLVRRAIYRITESGGNSIRIHKCNNHIENLTCDVAVNARELMIQFIEFTIDSDEYLNSLVTSKLTIGEASKIASVILKYSSSPKSELAQLRVRCGASPFEWGGIVEEIQSKLTQQQQLINGNKNASVTGDSGVDGDTCNVDTAKIAAIGTSVTRILNLGLTDYAEQQMLEEIFKESGLHKAAFWKLVNSQKNKIDAMQPSDEIRLNKLIDWHNNKLDFEKALPSMAAEMKHDADILNIDPIMIWQALLPAVLSQVGKKIKLQLGSYYIPCIAWTISVAESGTGKTRADSLVFQPLRQLQKGYKQQFQEELFEWEEARKNNEEGEVLPPKPVERKTLFEVATIQAVMRRASEQGNWGQLWSRDELAGLFKSFNQFGKGETEALECFLRFWDGAYAQVDRVNQEDSYLIDETAISVSGGIQPGVYRSIFKDPNDSQGLTARFLIAMPKARLPERVQGTCCLSEILPLLYSWLRELPAGEIKLSSAADAYYTRLYKEIGQQAHNTSQPAIRAWLIKLMGSNLLRIALGLHFIECFNNRNRTIWELQKDTLERAVLFAQYYRSAFHVLQETTTDSDDISSILLKIWDAAATKHPDGISTRDAYRNIKAIQYRAKDMGRDVSAYTAELFGMLELRGKGKVVQNGRTIKFVANIGGTEEPVVAPNPEPVTPTPGTNAAAADIEASVPAKPDSDINVDTDIESSVPATPNSDLNDTDDVDTDTDNSVPSTPESDSNTTDDVEASVPAKLLESESEPENTNNSDTVTEAETLAEEESEASPQGEASLVTQKIDEEKDTEKRVDSEYQSSLLNNWQENQSQNTTNIGRYCCILETGELGVIVNYNSESGKYSVDGGQGQEQYHIREIEIYPADYDIDF